MPRARLPPRIQRAPLTLDAIDILLSKLQIVELNDKDARDIFQLLSGLPVGAPGRGASAPFLDTERFGQLLAADWGWWRTVTGNLDKLPALAAKSPHLVPAAATMTRSPRPAISPSSPTRCPRA